MQIAVEYRSLRPEDAQESLNFRKQVALDSTHTMQYVGQTQPTVDEARDRIIAQSTNPKNLNLAAFDGQKMVASLGLRMSIPDHPWVQHLGQFGMMVLKEYWGQKIGKSLIAQMDAHAQKVGFTRIEGMVRVKNERGLRLYKSTGFEIEGTRKRAAKINGEYEDEHFIAKLYESEFRRAVQK